MPAAAGNGQAAKICNNMILGISMIAVSEAFVLAEKLGLDAQKLFDISSKSSGQCWSMTSYCPVPGPVPTRPPTAIISRVHRRHDAEGSEARAGRRARRAAPRPRSGAGAAAIYGQYVESGEGGRDFSGIIRFLRGE